MNECGMCEGMWTSALIYRWIIRLTYGAFQLYSESGFPALKSEVSGGTTPKVGISTRKVERTSPTPTSVNSHVTLFPAPTCDLNWTPCVWMPRFMNLGSRRGEWRRTRFASVPVCLRFSRIGIPTSGSPETSDFQLLKSEIPTSKYNRNAP